MSNTITRISVNVGAGANVDFQPSAKEAWEVNLITSNNVFVSGVPDVQVALKKAAATAIMLLDPTTDPGNRGRMHKYIINNTVFLNVTNTGGAGAEIGIIGNKINPFNVLSDVVAIGAGATINIDPGAGNALMIYEMGSGAFSAGEINPNITVNYDDGVLSAGIIWDPTMIWGHDKQLAIPVSHDLQLAVTDSDGGGQNFGYSAEKLRNMVYQYEDVLAGADMDIVPPAGQEWIITCIANELLAGAGAPDNYPDCNVMILVGANESNILEAGSTAVSPLWNAPIALRIDNTNNLRLHNANVAAANIAVAGFRVR